MGAVVLIALLVVVNIGLVSATKCLECQDMPEPWACDIITTCMSTEACYVEQIISSGGLVLYNSGCLAKSTCKSKKKRDTWQARRQQEVSNKDIPVCVDCCDGDFCNTQGCGETALARPLRGPKCFSCDAQSNPESCRDVQQCDPGQVCALYKPQPLGTLWKSECASSIQCNAMVTLYNTLNGRRRDVKTINKCPRCCEDDFCNHDCFQNVSLATTLPTTTTVKSTHHVVTQHVTTAHVPTHHVKTTPKATTKPTVITAPTTVATKHTTVKPTHHPVTHKPSTHHPVTHKHTPSTTVKPTHHPVTHKHTPSTTVKPTHHPVTHKHTPSTTVKPTHHPVTHKHTPSTTVKPTHHPVTHKHTPSTTVKPTHHPVTHKHTPSTTVKPTHHPVTHKQTPPTTVKPTHHPVTHKQTPPTTKVPTTASTAIITSPQTMAPTSDPAAACKADHYIYFADLHLCLKFHTTPRLNWTDAQAFCEKEKGKLAIITGDQKVKDVAESLAKYRSFQGVAFWVGANDKADAHVFQWLDGSTYIIDNTANVDMTSANCLYINDPNPQSTNFSPCREQRAFVCERKSSIRTYRDTDT